jgi:CrcB protein
VVALKNFLLVAGAGALGASLRYAVSLSALRAFPAFPFVGTVIVNVLGCFLFGAVFQASEQASWSTPQVRLFLLTGFLGAFTTFSTFSFDTVQLFDSRGLPAAALYVLVQNGVGIACAVLGIAVGRSLA